jgi:hypothetical protein
MKYINVIAVVLTIIAIIISYVNKDYEIMAFNSFLFGANLMIVIHQLINDEL